MGDDWGAIETVSFELVPIAPSRCMLRVAGHGPRITGRGGPRPALVVEHEGVEHRFDPLPAPADPPGVLRAAYSVPAGIIALDSRYRLAHPSGDTTPLPAPATRRVEAGESSPGAGCPPLDREPAALQVELDEIREQLRRVSLERDGLARRVADRDEAASSALTRAAELEAENRQLRSSLEELEVWRGELERRLADATTALHAARSQREPVREEPTERQPQRAAQGAERPAMERARRKLRESLARRLSR